MRQREHGQALIETLLLGLFLMIPLLWGLGILAELHRAALGTTSAAREAGFELARSASSMEGGREADRAIARALIDHGMDPENARVQWTMNRLERGSPVEVVISFPVPVVAAPFIGSVSGPSVWVHAKSVSRVDLYRSRR